MARRSIVKLLRRCLTSVPAACSKLRRDLRSELDLIERGAIEYDIDCATCGNKLKVAIQVCDSMHCAAVRSLRDVAEPPDSRTERASK